MKKAAKRKKKTENTELTEDEQLDRNIKKKTMLIKRLKHDAVFKVIGFTAVLIVVFTCVFGITRVTSSDMHPTLETGDWVFYLRVGGLVNTDVIVYKSSDGQKIGRIQATEGSELSTTEDDRLTIDGSFQPVQPDSGIYSETYIKEGGSLALPVKLESGQYLVLGDNRESSKDSRDYGLIDKKDIKGKVLVVIRRRPL